MANCNADMLPGSIAVGVRGCVITPPIRVVLPLALEISGNQPWGYRLTRHKDRVPAPGKPLRHPQHRMLGEGRA